MKTKIRAQSLPWQKPYENLKPIVEALIEAGNKLSPTFGSHVPNRDGFYMERDGWVCDLQLPIDSALVEHVFDIPTSIRINPTENTISDDKSWSQIRGAVK